MKRTKEHLHTLHLLKHALTKLRKAITSNCERDLVNCISECVLNVLNSNVSLTQVSKHRLALRKLVDRHVLLQGKKLFIVQGGGSSFPY